jgi:hypothetical protein
LLAGFAAEFDHVGHEFDGDAHGFPVEKLTGTPEPNLYTFAHLRKA